MIAQSREFPIHKTLLMAAAVFCVLYNIAFIGFESLSLGRLAVVFLFFWAIYEQRSPARIWRTRAWVLFLPAPAVAAQFILVPDFGQLSRFVYLAYFSFFGAALVATITRDMGLVLRIVLLAISTQAVFLFISFFSPSYRAWFDGAVLTGSNFDANYLYRAPGFSSEAGSSLSVIQAFGVFAGWLLLRENSIYATVRGKATYLVFLGVALSFLSCVVVGRTGLLLSCVFFGFLLISFGIRPRLVFFFGLLLTVSYAAANYFLGSLIDSGFSVDFFMKWAFGFFSGNDDTVSTLAAMPIPPLNVDTIFGTGLESMVDGVNPSGHDSGFIQAYFSMGLLLTVFLYSLYLYALCYILAWLPLVTRAAVVLLVFGLDIKEPFLFKYSTMFILMALHFCYLHYKKSHKSLLIE